MRCLEAAQDRAQALAFFRGDSEEHLLSGSTKGLDEVTNPSGPLEEIRFWLSGGKVVGHPGLSADLEEDEKF